MSAATVKAIKAPRRLAAPVAKQIDSARDHVLDAHAITTVVSAAVLSELISDPVCISRTLGLVSQMLGNVANLIEPAALEDIAVETQETDDF